MRQRRGIAKNKKVNRLSDDRTPKKMSVHLDDTSVMQAESIVTRSMRKAGLANGNLTTQKNATDEKLITPEKTPRNHTLDMQETGAMSNRNDGKIRTSSEKPCPESNEPVKQQVPKTGSSTKSSKRGKFATVQSTSAGHNKDKALRDLKKSPTILKDWVIKPVPQCHGICVEGQVEGKGDFWHSTTIAEALEPKLVVTSTGSLYKLKGRINKLVAYEYGISKDVAKAFTNGFPSTWKDLIEDYYQIMESSITVTQECMSPEKFQSLKTKKRVVQDKTILEPVDIHTILTPTGLLKKEMNRSELTTTRSGRISLPPLAGWAGQYYVKTPGKNSVQVQCVTDTANQALGKETMHALALSKRDQLMLCRNALSKSLIISSRTTSAKSLPSQKKKDSQSKTPNGINSNGKVLERFSGIFSAEKENVCDTSFLQPEVRVEDCIVASFTKLKYHTQPGKYTDQVESVSPEKQVQSQKRKTKKPVSRNSSKAAKQKKLSGDLGGQMEQNLLLSTNEQPKLLQTSNTLLGQAAHKEGRSDLGESSIGPKASNKKSVKTSRKRKIDDEDKTCQNSSSGMKDKKAKPEPRSKKQKMNPENCADEDSWTQPEKERFHKALKELSADEPDYWSLVAEQVGTKSEQDCQTFHKEFLEVKTAGTKKPAARKPQKGKKESGREKGGPIRGGKGTLKRKQDIRDFLDEQNEGYEDDPFEGTPFIKSKHNPLMPDVNIDFSKEDSEIFGTNHNFFTPVAGKNPFDTPGLKFKAMLPSVKKTPANQTTGVFKATPQSVDMRKHDICIKQFKDQKMKAMPSKVSPPPEDLEASVLPIKSLFPGAAKIFVDTVIEEDPEEEEDAEENEGNQFIYYFDDDDD
ncbi:hypothetical protein EGW08_020828 [Elysia chlorotica]|uniref:Myb-like domain-containing protein n=1 Tax=Elysia chlorotica TaxID=188477 RepID=A0A433SQ75_ELYCH|nr:hypothetical protein EGW08_020828 [Elysia chlorotica]